MLTGRSNQEAASVDKDYYPQIEKSLRQEAVSMSRHYEVFYALERSIRRVVGEQLLAEYGSQWWEQRVPEAVRLNADRSALREKEAGFTPRSTEMLDYTTFGELGEVIRANWEAFEGVFNNKKALDRILGSLNTLRGPIAHCCPLAEDEVLRLRLTVRDWFRLME